LVRYRTDRTRFLGSLSLPDASLFLHADVSGLLAAGDVELLALSDPVTTQSLFELYCRIEPYSWVMPFETQRTTEPDRTIGP